MVLENTKQHEIVKSLQIDGQTEGQQVISSLELMAQVS